MLLEESKLKTIVRGAALAASLALLLGGCADNTNASTTKNSGAQASAAVDTPASAKGRISKLCMADPEHFFGSANTQAHCDCYGDGVSKMLSKDELGYLATYNEIPSLSSTEYDKVKQRCLTGAAPAPDKKPAKKKAEQPKSE